MKNKRGWIKIVEAFIAILLVAGVLLITINRGYIGKADISEQVYQIELSVLKEIELNSTLRDRILKTPIGEEDSPLEIVEKINQRTPDYLNCTSKICNLNAVCSLDEYIEKDIYAQSVAITAEGTTYSPRQLKLFCWTAG